ncbi:MAG: penicillin-binding protein activator LpoB [Candidatus Malihini olakiniferum]
MKKYLLLTLKAMVLTGCMTHSSEQRPDVVAETVQPVHAPQNTQTLNWEGSVTPLLAKMLQTSDSVPGMALLVDSVKNNTNGSLSVEKVTMAIYDALSNNKKFMLVPQEKVTVAKQMLGLSADDSLGLRSKAIGLARYMNAQYMLYSDVSGDTKRPQLDMQLIMVQTGELVWSGSGAVK